MKFPYLSHRQIQDAAAETVRVAFGEEAPYPLNLDYLVFEHFCDRDHLIFDNQQDLATENGDVVLGKTLPLSRKILITSSLRTDHEGRYRFTVAHEIAHWVLHRHLFVAEAAQPGLFQTTTSREQLVSLNRNVFPADKGRSPVPPEEWQANQFAAALLIDPRVLHEAFSKRFGAGPIARRQGGGVRAASLRALSRSLANQSVRGLEPLNELFRLSREAMAVGLETRGYVVEDAPLL